MHLYLLPTKKPIESAEKGGSRSKMALFTRARIGLSLICVGGGIGAWTLHPGMFHTFFDCCWFSVSTGMPLRFQALHFSCLCANGSAAATGGVLSLKPCGSSADRIVWVLSSVMLSLGRYTKRAVDVYSSSIISHRGMQGTRNRAKNGDAFQAIVAAGSDFGCCAYVVLLLAGPCLPSCTARAFGTFFGIPPCLYPLVHYSQSVRGADENALSMLLKGKLASRIRCS